MAQTDSLSERTIVRRAVLLVNAKSRSGRDNFELAKATLATEGVELTRAQLFSHCRDLVTAAKASIDAQVPVIIAGGGDGTLNSVAGLLAHSASSLGILPMGTGNEFARDLHLPMNIAEACHVVRHGKVIQVDLGKLQNQHFVNVATIGLTSEIARQLTSPMKKRFGRLAYAVAVLRGIRHLKPLRVRLTTENGSEEFECMQLVIGNGRLHAGPFPVLPDASLRAGKFSIYALKGNRRSELIKYAFMLPGGHHATMAEVHSEYASGGEVQAYPPAKVIVDGEAACSTPIKFHCLPGALNVIAPQDFNG